MFTNDAADNLAPISRSFVTQKRIVAATRKLLAMGDLESLSMRAVAAEAGVSPGAIYKHFSDKRHLVDHVSHATLEEFELDLARVIAPYPPGSFDRVVALGSAYIQLALRKPEHFKILFTPVRPEPTPLRDLPGEGGFQLLRDCVAEAMEAGQIRQDDPELAAFFLWSRVHGIVTLMMACDFRESLPLPESEITPQRLFELSRAFLWEGFKPADDKGTGHSEAAER
jgi:AcrR family transcriptional regulator